MLYLNVNECAQFTLYLIRKMVIIFSSFKSIKCLQRQFKKKKCLFKFQNLLCHFIEFSWCLANKLNLKKQGLKYNYSHYNKISLGIVSNYMYSQFTLTKITDQCVPGSLFCLCYTILLFLSWRKGRAIPPFNPL